MRAAFLPLGVLGLIFLAGCGYSTRGLYYEEYKTVDVRIFKSNSLRRDVEFLITQKVQQAIQAQTSYRICSGEEADTILEGEITNYYKGASGEDGRDNPRGGSMVVILQVRWIDKCSGKIINEYTQRLTETSRFIIDNTQSMSTANNALADDVANQVVTMMQAPW